MKKSPQVCLLTGLPDGFLARRLLDQLLLDRPERTVLCIVDESGFDQAHEQLLQLASRDRQRVELVRGDVCAMDFGLSGAGYLDLAARVDVIHHCVCASQGSMSRDSERRHFVGSTGEVLELATARGSKVSQVVHWSSTRLFSAQSGRITESESSYAGGPRSRDDDARFRAELLVRDFMKRVPITILRPSTIVGDSKTGEMDRSEPAYALLQLIVNAPRELRLPIPGSGEQPCHFVPIDYVVEAGLSIADNPASIGRTFHLIDERPTSVIRALELVNEAAGRAPVPPGLARNLSALLFSAPRVERFGHVPRSFFDLLATDVFYESRNTRELLAGTGIECPALTSYLGLMVETAKHDRQPNVRPPRRTRRVYQHEELDDPLDV